jgi:hypothetical protein
LSLQGVASPSLLNHGIVRLVRVGGHVRALGVLQVPPSSSAAGAATTVMAGPSSSGLGVRSPQPRSPILGHSCRCPFGMRVTLSVGLHHSGISCSCSDIEGECFGDRSHTLVSLIVRRPTMRAVTPLYLPLVVSSAASMGDLALVSLSLPRMVAIPWEMPAPEAPGADDAPTGATNVEVDDVDLQPGDDVRGSHRGLVMRGRCVGVSRSVVPCDTSLVPRSTGAMGPRCSSMLLPGAHGLLPLHIN